MEGFFEVVALILQAIAIAIVAVVCWVAKGVYLGIYYTFHPHPEYKDFLGI